MFAAYLAFQAGLDPYLSLVPLAVLFFALGYGAQRLVIGPASHGEDRNVMLGTLGLSVMVENLLLAVFTSDTRTIYAPYGFSTIRIPEPAEGNRLWGRLCSEASRSGRCWR
jgi:branched-chain amino acid transport system permease protein